MTTAQLVANIYLTANGKLPTFLSGSTKWLKILAIANNKIDTWQNEANWDSLYDPKHNCGIITATDTFALDSMVRLISQQPGDVVTIVKLDGTKSYYQTVYAQQLKLYKTGKYCAQVGQTLVFNKAFTATDPEFGGTLQNPAYKFATHLVADADVVPVDDPQWLVLASSAEYVRNDIVKQNQYGPLVNEANALMDLMKDSLQPQVEELQRPYSPLSSSW